MNMRALNRGNLGFKPNCLAVYSLNISPKEQEYPASPWVHEYLES